MYWEVQGFFPNDSRFNYSRFGRQPCWLAKQAIEAGNKKRNLDQFTQAKILMGYTAAHSKDSKDVPEFSTFLPHPAQWKQYTRNYKIKIPARYAQIVLANYERYGADCMTAFAELIDDLKACL